MPHIGSELNMLRQCSSWGTWSPHARRPRHGKESGGQQCQVCMGNMQFSFDFVYHGQFGKNV